MPYLKNENEQVPGGPAVACSLTVEKDTNGEEYQGAVNGEAYLRAVNGEAYMRAVNGEAYMRAGSRLSLRLDTFENRKG